MVVRLYQDDEILNIIHPLCDLYIAVFQAHAAESVLFSWRVHNSVHSKRKPVVITVSLENELVGGDNWV